MKQAALWCLGAGLVLLALMGFDKKRAAAGRRRVNEATLFAWAILGGAWGGWLGMALFHHKSRKGPFRLGLPLLTLAWAAALTGLYLRG